MLLIPHIWLLQSSWFWHQSSLPSSLQTEMCCRDVHVAKLLRLIWQVFDQFQCSAACFFCLCSNSCFCWLQLLEVGCDMRQLGRSHMPPLMANSHLGLFCWRGRFMILFFQQVQVAPILLQLFKSRNESAYERPNAFHMAQAILSARWTFHTAAKEKIKRTT